MEMLFMEVKEWSYEEYPSFDEPIDGVERIPTTGDEKGAYIFSNVEYAHVDETTLHLQIIVPRTRNTTDSDETYPCIVYVQGSAWLKQNILQPAQFQQKYVTIMSVQQSVLPPECLQMNIVRKKQNRPVSISLAVLKVRMILHIL